MIAAQASLTYRETKREPSSTNLSLEGLLPFSPFDLCLVVDATLPLCVRVRVSVRGMSPMLGVCPMYSYCLPAKGDSEVKR